MDIQKLFDALSKSMERERSKYHLTLGKLIDELEDIPRHMKVVFDEGDSGPWHPHSYRGYYSDLAFEASEGVTVGGLLADCKESLGKEFTGYKGGEFIMRENTPLWTADYGCCGRAIVDIKLTNDRVILVTKDLDE